MNVPNPGRTVTWGDVFTVQPFGNIMQVITLAGAQIKAVPEQQFGDPVAGQNRILQVGRGFTYTRENAAKGSKVSNVQFGGAAIDPAASYRVTRNDFLTDGGDSFTVLAPTTRAATWTSRPSGTVPEANTVTPGAPSRLTRLSPARENCPAPQGCPASRCRPPCPGVQAATGSGATTTGAPGPSCQFSRCARLYCPPPGRGGVV